MHNKGNLSEYIKTYKTQIKRKIDMKRVADVSERHPTDTNN